MDKLTVLHACPVWLPRTQTWMYSQVADLQKLGVGAHVACEHTENLDQFAVEGLHCLANEPFMARLPDLFLRRIRIRHHLDYLVNVGRRIGAQIVHSHFGNIGWSSLGAVLQLRARHVVTFYGLDVNWLPTQKPIWRSRYRQLFEEVDLILCEGSHMAKCMIDLGCLPAKVRIQHLGVDVSRIEFRPRSWRPGEPLRVLIAATFVEKKGIPYAIEALGRIHDRIPVALTLIGDAGHDRQGDIEKNRILDVLRRSGLISHTTMMGFQPHDVLLREAYAHHIFLQPSVTAANGDTEGGAPVSVIEMLATGMPVVSTRHCDIPEVFGPHLQDLLAEERDVSGLVEILSRLVASPEIWLAKSQAARARVEAEYNRYTQAKRLVAHYSSLIGQVWPA